MQRLCGRVELSVLEGKKKSQCSGAKRMGEGRGVVGSGSTEVGGVRSRRTVQWSCMAHASWLPPLSDPRV